jgi:transcriptional regulator with XRE-family HTH domain
MLGAKRARIEAGFTLRTAASELGVSVGSLWRWEAGTQMPSIEKLQELAELDGVPITRLMKAPKPTRRETRAQEKSS